MVKRGNFWTEERKNMVNKRPCDKSEEDHKTSAPKQMKTSDSTKTLSLSASKENVTQTPLSLSASRENVAFPSLSLSLPEPSSVTPLNCSINKQKSAYSFRGKMIHSNKLLQGDMEEKGSDLEEIGLEVLKIPMTFPVIGEITITSLEGEPSGTEPLNAAQLATNYPLQQDVNGFVINHNSELLVENVKAEGTGFTCQVTGLSKTLEGLSVRMGAGGVAFWITSGEKIGKIRILPRAKKTNYLTWKRDGKFLNLKCK